MGYKLAVAALYLYPVEMLTHFGYPLRIANGDDIRSNFFGTQVEVIDSAVIVNDQFRFSNTICHVFVFSIALIWKSPAPVRAAQPVRAACRWQNNPDWFSFSNHLTFDDHDPDA